MTDKRERRPALPHYRGETIIHTNFTHIRRPAAGSGGAHGILAIGSRHDDGSQELRYAHAEVSEAAVVAESHSLEALGVVETYVALHSFDYTCQWE